MLAERPLCPRTCQYQTVPKHLMMSRCTCLAPLVNIENGNFLEIARCSQIASYAVACTYTVYDIHNISFATQLQQRGSARLTATLGSLLIRATYRTMHMLCRPLTVDYFMFVGWLVRLLTSRSAFSNQILRKAAAIPAHRSSSALFGTACSSTVRPVSH